MLHGRCGKNKMKVLLTGHNGYIGSVMTTILQQAGHTVVGLDTFFFEDCTLMQDATPLDQIIRKDIRDITSSDLEGIEAVVHLAALSNDPLGDLDPTWTYDINFTASVQLAKHAKEAGVSRFIYSSSCSMYGASGGDDLLTEDAPLCPLTAYAISKVRTEEEVTKLAGPGFSPVFMRNATAYGASPRLRADIVLNNLVGWAYTTGKIRILSDGSPWRPIVHIQDISYAFLAALEAPIDAVHNQAINIGCTDGNYRVREMADIVKKVLPDCEIEYADQAGPDPRNYRVDFSKLGRILPAFRPRWNAELGARELLDAYRQNHLTFEDFQGRKFVRLKQLKFLLSEKHLDPTLRWQKEENKQ